MRRGGGDGKGWLWWDGVMEAGKRALVQTRSHLTNSLLPDRPPTLTPQIVSFSLTGYLGFSQGCARRLRPAVKV
eukprot:359053-Chlamydomonas_euryale.AAC.1